MPAARPFAHTIAPPDTPKRPRAAPARTAKASAQSSSAAPTASRRPAAKRRAADLAYDAIEQLIATLQLEPGSPVVEAEITDRTGLGRTPVREALMRMTATGLITQQPRRGLLVSSIDLADHLDVLQTRRSLENLIAASSARRASKGQRDEILTHANTMVAAARQDDLDAYMQADHLLDVVNHQASRNASAANAVLPLVVLCRRFWYAYRDVGDIAAGARAHLELARGIHTGDEQKAVQGANRLVDYLDAFTRRVIAR